MAHQVCVAQMDKSVGLWLRRSAVRARPHTPYTACSSVDRAPGRGPGGRRFKSAHAFHGILAQLVERQTEDLRVSGSIPESPTSPSMEARTGDCAGLLSNRFTKANKSEPYLPGWRWVRILLFLRAVSDKKKMTFSTGTNHYLAIIKDYIYTISVSHSPL